MVADKDILVVFLNIFKAFHLNLDIGNFQDTPGPSSTKAVGKSTTSINNFR
jgi:hypothetical protein